MDEESFLLEKEWVGGRGTGGVRFRAADCNSLCQPHGVAITASKNFCVDNKTQEHRNSEMPLEKKITWLSGDLK